MEKNRSREWSHDEHRNSMEQTTFTATDGKLIISLQSAAEGGYIVTSPMDPELITEAETLEEAFENSRDAIKSLRQARRQLAQHIREDVKPGRPGELVSVAGRKQME